MLALVTASGLIYNVGLLVTPWFEGRLAQCLADILGGNETAAQMAVLVLVYIAVTLLVQVARGDVALSHVTFGYGEKPVLEDFSLTVKQGEQVMLVGRTGAGKSTVFRLLLGLYPPQSGTVTIGGVDVAAISDGQRRPCIRCVEQHPCRSGRSRRAAAGRDHRQSGRGDRGAGAGSAAPGLQRAYRSLLLPPGL